MTSQEFIDQSLQGLILQNDAHAQSWGLGKAERWAVDQERGEIVFTFADKTARAAVQIIGTYNTKDGTFLWGWDRPSVLPGLQNHAKLAHEWGLKNNVPSFVSRKVQCTENEAWGFTAVAARLAGANGAYRGPAGTALVFMTFGEIQLSKA